MSSDHHNHLHQVIDQADAISRWLYADCFFDCDGAAFERTGYRLTMLEQQHGAECLFGIAANWADLALEMLKEYFQGQEMPALLSLLDQDFNAAQLDTDERGSLSARQFIQAISNDDLEMAEALFLAANGTSNEDSGAFLNAVLNALLQIAHQFT